MSILNAFDKVAHLGLVTVRKRLFGKWPGPAEADIRLLDHIAGGLRRERCDGRGSRDIGKDRAFRSMNLITEIQAALRRPGKLAMSDAAALKLQHEQGIVFPFGTVAMDEGRAPGHHFHHLVLLAEKVSSRLHAMTPQVVQGATTGLVHIPEVRAMRS